MFTLMTVLIVISDDERYTVLSGKAEYSHPYEGFTHFEHKCPGFRRDSIFNPGRIDHLDAHHHSLKKRSTGRCKVTESVKVAAINLDQLITTGSTIAWLLNLF